MLNLLTMLNSAKAHGLDADRLVMVPHGDKALGYRALLESYGVHIVEVPPIAVPKSMQGKGDASHWGNVFTKFRAFNLTSYDRVLLIDSDAFFTGSGDPAKIFEDCGEHELCLVEDPTPELYINEDCPDAPDLCRQANTGVMVFTPSAARLDDVMQELEKDSHAYHFPDQQFFSRYLRISSSLDWKFLDAQWNNCGHDPAPKLLVDGTQPWVGHFCQSWKDKDHKNFRFAFCKEHSACSVTLRAWQAEVLALDPCLSVRSAEGCQAREGCGWHDTFCLDARLEAKGITFDQEPSP